MAEESTSPPRVGVVDDNPAGRYALARLLQSRGMEVEEAGTAREALLLAEQGRLEVLVLDYHLPDMTGLQLCQHLRTAGSTARLLLTSAIHPGGWDLVESRKAGADGYLRQPFEVAEVEAWILALVRLHRLEAEVSRQERAPAVPVPRSPTSLEVPEDVFRRVTTLAEQARAQAPVSSLHVGTRSLLELALRRGVATLEVDYRRLRARGKP